MTFDSCISCQRSLPSRVRSPTPANTEKPPWCKRNVVDELHDDDGLADTGAAEESDLAALAVRLKQIHDLDAGLEHFRLGFLIFQLRRGTVNRIGLLAP